jgi:GDP-L-fucose synthase
MAMSRMQPASRIYVAGHRGLVGSAIARTLDAAGYGGVMTRTRAELDLRDRAAVERFFAAERPEYVFIAAAKVGGIHANASQPAAFIHDNLAIQTNLIDAAWRHDVAKLLFLGSSCIYPKLAPQPIREEYLLTGPLEPTNEAYAIAKIAGLKMCAAYRAQYGFDAIALMPTNIYGPGDNFDLATSHVLPALIRKAHEAKISGAASMPVWGTGTPRREFLHVDDLAAACVFCMERYSGALALNVGVGEDVTIRALVETVCDVVGFQGELAFDATKPDGTMRKWLDVGRLNDLGWRARIGLRDGIDATYRWCTGSGGVLAA